MFSLLAAAGDVPFNFDLNTFLGGGSVAIVIGIGYFVIKLLFDRAIPTKTDNRQSISLVIDSLNTTIKIMQEEKNSDLARLSNALDRADRLEKDSQTDFERANELRAEIVELRNRLVRKDHHITTLVRELNKLGITVEGYKEDSSGPLQIMYPEGLASR